MVLELLGCALFAAFGLLLWAKAWSGWRLRVDMQRWPRAPAVIRGYRVRPSSRSRPVDVEVSYRHEGHDYTVWCRTPMGSAYGKGDVQAVPQVAASFPVGSTHSAYVHPTRRGEAFLLLPEPHMLAMLVGFGVMLLGVAAALVLPLATTVDQELATLGFFLLVGVVLSVLVVFCGVALYRLPRPRGR